MSRSANLSRVLYRRLISLYPQPFREQLGESMAQTFDDLYRERQRRPTPGARLYLCWLFAETAISIPGEHVRTLLKGDTMPRLLSTHRAVVILGLLLVLPLAGLMVFRALNLEPPVGPLQRWLVGPAGGPHLVGSAVVAGAWLLALYGAVINVRSVVRDLRAGQGLAVRAASLLLAGAMLVPVLLLVGLIVVDQAPCWAGVPNCD